MSSAIQLSVSQSPAVFGAPESAEHSSSQDIAIAHQSLSAALRGRTPGLSETFEYPGDRLDSYYALDGFIWQDEEAGASDGRLTRQEAEKKKLNFVDLNGDGYMSASEIDFFGEADKVGKLGIKWNIDDLLCAEEARGQGLAFFDSNADGHMSRDEYAQVQSGEADVFGAADRAHEKDGAVVDGLINRQEAEDQGLMFFDGNGDGLMSRDEHANFQSDNPDLFEAADRAHEKDGAVVDGLINLEESEDQGLIFFDGNGDGLMSTEEFSLVAHHQVGGLPAHRHYLHY